MKSATYILLPFWSINWKNKQIISKILFENYNILEISLQKILLSSGSKNELPYFNLKLNFKMFHITVWNTF